MSRESDSSGRQPPTTELAWLDAVAQAELVRTGAARSRELVDAAVRQIARINPVLNFLIEPMYEQAYGRHRLELELPRFRGHIAPFL